MTELQLPDPPYHPALHRASELVAATLIPIFGITLAVTIPFWLGWISFSPWLSSAIRVSLTLGVLAEALKRLSTVRPDSLTRRMRWILAVLLPVAAAFLDPDHFQADAALVASMAFGVAYTADTQTGFRAWSLDRWLATVGSLGFVLLLAGAFAPDPLGWVARVASIPLLVMALNCAMRLWEDEVARDEDGARDADPAALTGAAPRVGA
jgi:hypothetical protein